MNPKSKVLSLMERTGNLDKSSSKNMTANTTASSIAASDSPVKRIKKPPSLSISESLTKTPSSRPLNSVKNSSLSSRSFVEGLNKSSLEFVKNINFALADLTTSNEKLSKKSREFISEEQKTLKYLKALIEEQKKLSKTGPVPENFESFDIGEQQVKLITQEAAEDLCMLEKKCQELLEDNEEMQKVLNGLEVQTPERHQKPRLTDVSQILQQLASHGDQNIGKEAKSVRKVKIHGNYSNSISSQVSQWSSQVKSDSSELLIDLCKLVLKVQHKSQKKHSELQQKLNQSLSQRSHLEQKIRSLEPS